MSLQSSSEAPLRIVHCIRSPIGGIFRHLADLAQTQADQGHEVGIVCDSLTGGAFEDAHIERLRPSMKLGIVRFPMRRAVSASDLAALWRMYRHLANLKPDVLHAHGSKGGAYARIIGTLIRMSGRKVARFYCPHGGVLHFDAASREGRFYFAFERLLERLSDGLIFVSDYERRNYIAKVGVPRVPTTLTYNGLTEAEWLPVPSDPDARDFVFAGMMRDLKGIDLMIEAIAHLHAHGLQATAHLYGDGPDRPRYEARVAELGLAAFVAFHDPAPIRGVFARGKTMVVPSRAESMPYIVIEAIAAHVPLIATDVGGVPEIYGALRDRLVTPDSVEALASAMAARLADPMSGMADADALWTRARPLFSLEAMAGSVFTAYRETLGLQSRPDDRLTHPEPTGRSLAEAPAE